MSGPQPSQPRTVAWLPVAAAAVALVLVVLLVAGVLAHLGTRASRDEKAGGLGEEFAYELDELAAVDPKHVSHEQTATLELALAEARGLAVGPQDRIYVAGDSTIAVFGKEGARQSEIALGGQPRAVAVAPDGTLYVAMEDRVEVYSPKGTRQASWPSLGDKALLTALAVAGGDVFAADAGNRVVVRYDTQGKLLGRIGRRDRERNIPGILVPSPYFDVAVGTEGLLWVTNPGRRRMEAYTFDGDLEVSWGTSSFAIDGFCGCCNPTHFALFRDGRVVTSEKGLPRVKLYDEAGRFKSVVAAPKSFDIEARGLDLGVDSAERVLVLDPSASQVRIFTRKAAE